MRFSGKTALITGAASGIGRAVAEAFRREGANVALNDVRDLSELVNALSREHSSGHVADVSDPAAVDDMLMDVIERWGRLDIVCANAGINRDGFLHQLTVDDWNAVLGVNLSGAFHVCRAAIPKLGAGGAVVLTSSVSALGNLGQSNYAASKAGLVGLTRALALECAQKEIRINAIAPGFTDTPMVASIPDKVRSRLIDGIPLKRLAQPEEIARAMLFLVSSEASYITGQTLFVDGGASVGL